MLKCYGFDAILCTNLCTNLYTNKFELCICLMLIHGLLVIVIIRFMPSLSYLPISSGCYLVTIIAIVLQEQCYSNSVIAIVLQYCVRAYIMSSHACNKLKRQIHQIFIETQQKSCYKLSESPKCRLCSSHIQPPLVRKNCYVLSYIYFLVADSPSVPPCLSFSLILTHSQLTLFCIDDVIGMVYLLQFIWNLPFSMQHTIYTRGDSAFAFIHRKSSVRD